MQKQNKYDEYLFCVIRRQILVASQNPTVLQVWDVFVQKTMTSKISSQWKKHRAPHFNFERLFEIRDPIHPVYPPKNCIH